MMASITQSQCIIEYARPPSLVSDYYAFNGSLAQFFSASPVPIGPNWLYLDAWFFRHIVTAQLPVEAEIYTKCKGNPQNAQTVTRFYKYAMRTVRSGKPKVVLQTGMSDLFRTMLGWIIATSVLKRVRFRY